jgi:hypothetical protein
LLLKALCLVCINYSYLELFYTTTQLWNAYWAFFSDSFPGTSFIFDFNKPPAWSTD